MQNKEEKNLSDLSRRFLQAIKQLGLSGYKLKKDNIISSESTLSGIKKGIQLPSRKTIDLLCQKYPVSKSWLYTGEGMYNKTESNGGAPDEKLLSEEDINASFENAESQSKLSSNVTNISPYFHDTFIKVKYIPVDAAASFVESLYNTYYEMDYYGVMPEEDEILDDTYIVFQVKGDSMEPTIPNGAKILARKIDEGCWENASGVVAIVYGKMFCIKRVLKNSLYLDNIITLKADNPLHGQLDIERREIRGMWQALRIVSQKII